MPARAITFQPLLTDRCGTAQARRGILAALLAPERWSMREVGL